MKISVVFQLVTVRIAMADLPKRVIVDVDVGTDDFVALLILLYADERGQIQIEAITCSMGNTTVDNVCKNVVRLLETVGRTDIPVYRGASTQLIPPNHEIKLFHGPDGFGGLEYTTQPDMSIMKKEPSASAIANLVLRNPNEISLICVGPLTNLALAIRLYDNCANSIKDLWIMGGNYTAMGNVTSTAEYNFYVDPEAAYIVLDSIKKPIFILTWETCLHPKITMYVYKKCYLEIRRSGTCKQLMKNDQEKGMKQPKRGPKSFENWGIVIVPNILDWRYNVFGTKNKPAIELLNRAEQSIYDKSKKIWLPCDAFLAAAFVDPDNLITKKSTHNASVELHGSQTRGQIVLDHLKIKEENVTIIENINTDLFMELLLKL